MDARDVALSLGARANATLESALGASRKRALVLALEGEDALARYDAETPAPNPAPPSSDVVAALRELTDAACGGGRRFQHPQLEKLAEVREKAQSVLARLDAETPAPNPTPPSSNVVEALQKLLAATVDLITPC